MMRKIQDRVQGEVDKNLQLIRKRNDLEKQMNHSSHNTSHNGSHNEKPDQKKQRVKVLKKQYTNELGKRMVDLFSRKKSKEKLTFGLQVDPNIDNDTWNR